LKKKANPNHNKKNKNIIIFTNFKRLKILQNKSGNKRSLLECDHLLSFSVLLIMIPHIYFGNQMKI